MILSKLLGHQFNPNRSPITNLQTGCFSVLAQSIKPPGGKQRVGPMLQQVSTHQNVLVSVEDGNHIGREVVPSCCVSIHQDEFTLQDVSTLEDVSTLDDVFSLEDVSTDQDVLIRVEEDFKRSGRERNARHTVTDSMTRLANANMKGL